MNIPQLSRPAPPSTLRHAADDLSRALKINLNDAVVVLGHAIDDIEAELPELGRAVPWSHDLVSGVLRDIQAVRAAITLPVWTMGVQNRMKLAAAREAVLDGAHWIELKRPTAAQATTSNGAQA